MNKILLILYIIILNFNNYGQINEFKSVISLPDNFELMKGYDIIVNFSTLPDFDSIVVLTEKSEIINIKSSNTYIASFLLRSDTTLEYTQLKIYAYIKSDSILIGEKKIKNINISPPDLYFDNYKLTDYRIVNDTLKIKDFTLSIKNYNHYGSHNINYLIYYIEYEINSIEKKTNSLIEIGNSRLNGHF